MFNQFLVLGLLLGLFVGTSFGVSLMALMTMAKCSDTSMAMAKRLDTVEVELER